MSFNKIKGQEKVIFLLKKTIQNKRIASGYLFYGSNGVGKRLTAKEFAKAVNCMENEDDACDSCRQCKLIEKEIHPDVIWVFPEGNSQEIKISQTREILSSLYLKPHQAKRKFFIIELAEKLNIEASNALLKALEEPPVDSTFILITEFPERLVSTISSRCQKIKFLPLSQSTVEYLLNSNYNFEDEDIKTLAKLSQGSFKKAVSFIDKDITKLYDEVIDFFLRDKINEDRNLSFRELRQTLKDKLNTLGYILRDTLFNLKELQEFEFLSSEKKYFIDNISDENLMDYIEKIDYYIKALEDNVNPAMIFINVKKGLSKILSK
jgi:DNA polymerase-3 subunit delta'